VVDNNKEKDDFEFEIERNEPTPVGAKTPEKPVIEVEDDTPEEDRGRSPMPEAIVAELEADELEEYSDKVKTRLKQMKKVWHDERREKERAFREQQEVVTAARKLLDENKRLKATLFQGEQTLVQTYRSAAELEIAAARRAYKEAYEAGDSNAVTDAQEKLIAASNKLESIKNYRPTLQAPETEVQNNRQEQSVPQAPVVDAKTRAWQERNMWWGTDDEMTASALGLHQKLQKQYGGNFVGTDEYWRAIDNTMQRRFPEYFGEEKPTNGGGKPVSRNETRPATVVAPASRSTSSKKIVLKQSQLNIAKKLGLTPEQYAREIRKMEN
jgi:hypothetical protein